MQSECGIYIGSPSSQGFLSAYRLGPTSYEKIKQQKDLDGRKNVLSLSASKASFASNSSRDTNKNSFAYVNAMKALQLKIHEQEQASSSTLKQQVSQKNIYNKEIITDQLRKKLETLEIRHSKAKTFHEKEKAQLIKQNETQHQTIVKLTHQLKALQTTSCDQQQELEDQNALQQIDVRHKVNSMHHKIEKYLSQISELDMENQSQRNTIETLKQQLLIEQRDCTAIKIQHTQLLTMNDELHHKNTQLEKQYELLSQDHEQLSRNHHSINTNLRKLELYYPLRLKQLESQLKDAQEIQKKSQEVQLQFEKREQDLIAHVQEKDEQIRLLSEQLLRKEVKALETQPTRDQTEREQSERLQGERMQTEPDQLVQNVQSERVQNERVASSQVQIVQSERIELPTPTPQKRLNFNSPSSKRYLLMSRDPDYERNLKQIVTIEIQVKDLDQQYEMIVREAQNEVNMKRKIELRQQLMHVLAQIKTLNEEKSNLVLAQKDLEKKSSS